MADAKRWSYRAGEKGSTRVRVYDRGPKGFYVEWFEAATPAGAPKRRVRQALAHTDRRRAKEEANALAIEFGRREPTPRQEFSLGPLFDMYLAEVTPEKGVSKRGHDERAAEMLAR